MREKFCKHFDVISGYAFKSADLRADGDIPVIKIGNISSGADVVEDSSTQYVSKDFLKINEKYHIKKEDILISLTGSHINQPNSMVGRVCRNYRDRIYLLNQRAGKVIPKEIESRDYIFYLLSSKCIKEDIANRAYGAANQVNISPSAIGNIKWDFPSIDIQKKIGDVLSSFDNLIEINNKRIKILEQMAENLYKEWFVRFRFLGYETAEFVDGVPKRWEYQKLKRLLEIFYGKDHKKIADGDIPIFGSGGIMRYGNKSLHDGEVILIPRKGTLNNIMYYSGKVWTVDTMFYAVSQIPNTAKYIYYTLNNFDMESYNSGAALPSMTTAILYNLKILLPDEKTLEKYDSFVGKLFEEKECLEKQNQNLIKQRDYLLPRLMSGKLQVK
ncbi:restriction endonuclease subunit S [Selenomonas ruminantium]|uniref:Type I restriction enzyme, S subunit n=1 Tax=Selenomonas ruminantium TaxID=971 RepID=A0A1H3WC78_SELRU|nr:restriction endonuclease subunit S [Selenomonas ruminantium]SDZ84723.1 type I restriction enzyme, S subunit [Selenomonas ruminantium]